MMKQVTQSALITALYRRLLGRDPDAVGARDKMLSSLDSIADFEALIDQFLDSKEMQSRTGLLRQDSSQFGEISLLVKRWTNEASRHRIVVDVGARGKERSNSYDLLNQFGWRGILIEANPALIPSIKVAFANLNAQVIQCAISDYSGMAILHLGVNDDVSSLQPDYAAGWGQIQGKQEVAVRRLGDLLLEQNIPLDFDLLSLDIEGEDIKVLNDTIGTFHYRPRWIIIEASFDFATTSLSQQAFSPLVQDIYEIVEQTRANLVLGMINR